MENPYLHVHPNDVFHESSAGYNLAQLNGYKGNDSIKSNLSYSRQLKHYYYSM